MKRLFFTLLFLFFIYFAIEALFYFFGPGHNVSYKLNDFEIKEEYINKQAKESQGYSFVVSDASSSFYFQIFKDYSNQTNIIKEIKSYKNNEVKCIIPIFIDDKALTDLMCLKDNIIYNYRNLSYSNEELKEFYNSLEKYFSKENLESVDSKNTITLYKSNMQPNYYVSFASYKGFIYANPTNRTLYSKNIYSNDVYDNYLSAYVDKYFVTVNYDEQYGYSKIYIYDIITAKEDIIILSRNIEKNSYIQGIHENSLYLFDRSNKIQYEIDVEAKTVLEVGNTSTGVKVYKNGAFERVSAHECANKDVIFENTSSAENNYQFIASTTGNKTGYTYYAKKGSEGYKIYRVNNAHKDQYTYLFDTSHIDKVIALNEYIYYIDENYIKYYSDYTGIRTLAYNSELNFNQNIEYQIIYQK